jgi:hypothetical protein
VPTAAVRDEPVDARHAKHRRDRERSTAGEKRCPARHVPHLAHVRTMNTEHRCERTNRVSTAVVMAADRCARTKIAISRTAFSSTEQTFSSGARLFSNSSC